MVLRKYKMLIIVVILGIVVSGTAMGKNHVVIGLKESINIALTNNQVLLASRKNIDMNDLERNIALSNFLPVLNIKQSVINSDNPVFAFGTLLNQGIFSESDFDVNVLNNPEAVTDYVTSVQVQVPVYNGGMEILAWKGSKIKQSKSRIELENVTEEIIYSVIEGYYNIILAREMLELAEKSVQTANANLELIQKLFDNGLVVKSDLLSAKVRLSHLRQQQIQAEYQVSLALSAFNTILSDETSTYDIEGNFVTASCPSLVLKNLEKSGVEHRSDLHLLMEQKKETDIRIGQAKGVFYPAVNAQFSYDYHGNNLFSDGSGSYIAAGSISLNLFKGLGDKARYYQTLKMKEILDHQIRGKIDQIKMEIRQAYYNVKSSFENLEVTEESIEQGEENLKIVKNRYNQGITTVVELLNAELLLSAARTDRIKALYSYSINLAKLCKVTGNIKERWELYSDEENVPHF